MLKKYTKGDKNNVLSRIYQVSSITINVPTSEKCMDYLYDNLIVLCYHYIDKDSGDLFLNIPAIDFYNVVLFVNKCCKEDNIDINIILSMMGIMRSFENLKYVSIIFKDDDALQDLYKRLPYIDSNDSSTDVINELANIYSINVMEMYLNDMFDQKVIDLINKHFIFNGIISNSYLERDFLIDFEFEEYISYINMFIDNNIDRLNMLDEDIVDYLRVFPSIIGDIMKPNIKLYTNYRDI